MDAVSTPNLESFTRCLTAVTDTRIIHPDDYSYSQGIGRQLRAEDVPGILYPSVRKPDGECLAALRTGILRDCLHSAYLEYNWNGQAIDAVFEVEQVA